MESRNSSEIPPKFPVRAGDLLLISALCRTNFAERRGVPLEALLNAIRSKPEARVRLPGPSCQRLR